MKHRPMRGFLAGLLASSVLVGASLGGHAAGWLPGVPFMATYDPLLSPLGLSSDARVVLGAAASIMSGAVWGHIYEALVRRSTPLTGAVFGVLPTLWLWLVTF